jgi:hypothetical protein
MQGHLNTDLMGGTGGNCPPPDDPGGGVPPPPVLPECRHHREGKAVRANNREPVPSLPYAEITEGVATGVAYHQGDLIMHKIL